MRANDRASTSDSSLEPIDALIVGSGFGGSVAALRLAEAGIRTVVLERGRRWPITKAGDTFATYDQPDGRAAWLSPVTVAPAQQDVPIDVFAGVLERVACEGIDVVNGAGVGGGSLIYNGVLYQPSRRTFERAFPQWLSYDEMVSVWYPQVTSVIRPEPMPADILATDFYTSTRNLLEQGRRAGLDTHLLELAVDWDIVRQEIDGSKPPSFIEGAIWYGVNSGAKKSLDMNYLSMAEASGRVEVLPLHVATDISRAGTGYKVSVEEIDEEGRILAKKEFLARHLFLAAGSFGTSSLLVRAKAKKTLTGLNQFVGTSWGSNGDSFAIRGNVGPSHPSEGGPAGAVVEDLDNDLGPTVVMNLPFPQAHLPEGSMATIAMTLGPPAGSFRFDDSSESVTLSWPAGHPDVERLAAAAMATYERLAGGDAADADRASVEFFDAKTTGHPCGGMPLGKGTDQFGEVKGHPALYVVDGSLIPGGNTACVNPALTIAALAERAMAHIIPQMLDRRPSQLATTEGCS